MLKFGVYSTNLIGNCDLGWQTAVSSSSQLAGTKSSRPHRARLHKRVSEVSVTGCRDPRGHNSGVVMLELAGFRCRLIGIGGKNKTQGNSHNEQRIPAATRNPRTAFGYDSFTYAMLRGGYNFMNFW
jgi:hypothetical protein